MKNRMKGILGIGVFVLSSVEQLAAGFYGRFFEQPIDPVVLLGIVGLVYAIQKFKMPHLKVESESRFIKFMAGSLGFSFACVGFGMASVYAMADGTLSTAMMAMVAIVKSLSSLSWCLATITALLALRDVFAMK